MNSFLTMELAPALPQISQVPTIIIGMDVSHGSPGRADVPSITAVVSSRQWPFISRYRAAVRTQSPKLKMIDSLYKKVSDTKDEGLFRELLEDFYFSSNKVKPEHIIIFRDGVSESQFNQVKTLSSIRLSRSAIIRTKTGLRSSQSLLHKRTTTHSFSRPNSPDNVPPGTVIDNAICHPKTSDFYMCAHAGPIGTRRPTHYLVLHDEIGFSADDMQELVHSLYQRSTTAISVAAQMSQFIKFDECQRRPRAMVELQQLVVFQSLHCLSFKRMYAVQCSSAKSYTWKIDLQKKTTLRGNILLCNVES